MQNRAKQKKLELGVYVSSQHQKNGRWGENESRAEVQSRWRKALIKSGS